MQPRLAEYAQIRVDGTVVDAVSDRDPADEVSRGTAVDDFENQRAFATAHLLGEPADELLDHRNVHLWGGSRPVPAPQLAVVPVQLDRRVGRLRAQHDDRAL